MRNQLANLSIRLRAVVLTMLTATVVLGAAPMSAHADTAEPRTFFFLDGDDGWTVVARVNGASAVGWIGIPETDATFCFRGTVTNGRLVGNSFNLIPETGEWVVDRLAVRATGVGSRFTVTAVAVGTRPNGAWKWDTRLSKATLAQASARLGRGLARDLASTPRGCARKWAANAGSEPQLTYLPDDPAPEPAPSVPPAASPAP